MEPSGPVNPALVFSLRLVTERAACAAFNWIGRGEGAEGARAGLDAMRSALAEIDIDAVVVIGEATKSEGSQPQRGERLGRPVSSFKADIALDPVEGTSYLVRGLTNALAVLAVAPRGAMMNPGPAFYMEKFVASPPARGRIDPHWPPAKKLAILAGTWNTKIHIFASDNVLRLGPQRQGNLTIFPNGVFATPIGCQITHPSCTRSACQTEEATRTTFATNLAICDPTSLAFANNTNCTAERQATPLFGFGLVEAVADATFDGIASSQPAAIRGVVKRVTEFGRTRVARFGWKDDIATLRAFSGGAYLNEMGITNPDNPNELTNCALNRTQFGVLLDAADDPEDEIEDDGRADTDRFAAFMRALDVPPTLQMNSDANAGQTLFRQIGCNGCHVETIRTASNPSQFVPPTTGGVPIDNVLLEVIIDDEDFHPFSDFLLHDMGSLGDGITSGAAGPRLMRTAPLWGVRGKSKLLHDGRATTIAEAVGFHDGQGAAAKNAFAALTATQQDQIVAFLMTR